MEGAKGEGRVFRHLWEVLRAYDEGVARPARADHDARPPAERAAFETTAGRLLFEEALPADYTERFGHIDDDGQEEGDGRHRRAPVATTTPRPMVADVARRDQEPLLPLRHRSPA